MIFVEVALNVRGDAEAIAQFHSNILVPIAVESPRTSQISSLEDDSISDLQERSNSLLSQISSVYHSAGIMTPTELKRVSSLSLEL